MAMAAHIVLLLLLANLWMQSPTQQTISFCFLKGTMKLVQMLSSQRLPELAPSIFWLNEATAAL